MNNFLAEGLALMKWRDQLSAIMTLSLEEISRQSPDISIVHTVPGVVESGISRDAQGFSIRMMLAVSKLLSPLIATPPAECAERHVFAATSAVFPPAKPVAAQIVGSEPTEDLHIYPGSNGTQGSGVYCLSPKSDPNGEKSLNHLKRHREDGTAKAVWDALMASYKGITGTAY